MADVNSHACTFAADYQRLGLDPGSSLKLIRRSYKDLALKCHPDKVDGSDEKFKTLNSAYIRIVEHIEDGSCELCSHVNPGHRHPSFNALQFKECSQCLVIQTGKEVNSWKKACQALYGSPNDLGQDHGHKFATQLVLSSEDSADSVSSVSRIHVTCFENGTVLVQGNAYLWWHTEHLPLILDYIANGTAYPPQVLERLSKSESAVDNWKKVRKKSSGKKPVKQPPPPTFSCCNEPDNKQMVLCSSCKCWNHYACCSLTKEELKFVTAVEDRTFYCDLCVEAQSFSSQLCSQSQQEEVAPLKNTPIVNNVNRPILDTSHSHDSGVTSGTPTSPHCPTPIVPSCATPLTPTGSSHTACVHQFSELSSRMDNLEAQLVKSAGVTSHFDSEKVNLVAEARSLRAENSFAKQEISSVRQSNKKLNSELDQLRSKSADSSIPVLSEKNLALKSELELIKLKSTSNDLLLNETISKLNCEIAYLKKSVLSLSSNLDSANNLLSTRNNQISELNDTLASTREELGSCKTRIEKRKKDLAAADHEVFLLQQELASFNDAEPDDFRKAQPRRKKHKSSGNLKSSAAVAPPPVQESSSYEMPKPAHISSVVTKSPPEMHPEEKRRGGHLIVTSSIGKDLHWKGVRPDSSSTVRIRAIPGGRVKSVQDNISKASENYSNDSISILVGSNDLNNGSSATEVLNEFGSLITTTRSLQPNCHIFIHKIPPRLDQREHNIKVSETNVSLRELCIARDKVSFVDNAIVENTVLFTSDGVPPWVWHYSLINVK